VNYDEFPFSHLSEPVGDLKYEELFATFNVPPGKDILMSYILVDLVEVEMK